MKFTKGNRALLLLAAMAAVGGCGKKKAGNVERGDATGQFPQVQSLGLGAAAGTSISLTTGDSVACDKIDKDMGIHAFGLGAACHVLPFTENLLVGENADKNADGYVNCSDYDEETSEGLLTLLMCNEEIAAQGAIKSFGFSDSTVGAIAFSDFSGDDVTGVGTFASNSSSNYPMNARIWSGKTLDSAVGFLGLSLSDPKAGTLYLSGAGAGASNSLAAVNIKQQFSFRADDASTCATEPTKTNCHWQETWITNSSSSAGGAPSGFHLMVYAGGSSKLSEDMPFLLMEGKYVWSDAMARTVFTGYGGTFANIRKLYLRLVVRDKKVLGAYLFRNGSNQELTFDFGGQSSYSTKIKNGLCSKAGSVEEVSSCGLTLDEYKTVFQGEALFQEVTTTTSVIPDIFSSGKPTTTEVVK